ncbi:MAG TPA: alpha/beta hydrolase [Allosphingosinicella sp.]|nr:alpha/beta hydrolase [Allosphingosinicella sp.]
MNRRHFILSGTALALGCARAAPAAPDFAPTRFSVEVRGSGPDVILIPGLASGRGIWAELVRAVPGYRYHLIHVHGFAGAPAGPNRRGAIVSPLAEEVARYIRQARLRRPALIGHSMGGTVAMMIGARYPSLAGRIMVVDMLPEPAGMIGGSASGAGALANSLFGSDGGRRLVGALMSNFSPPDSSLRSSDADVVARTMNELAAIDLTPILPGIRAPMTITYASFDRRAAPTLDRTFARAYAGARNARFVRIDNSGHMVMLDQPARFAAAVREFLTR